MSDNQMKVSFVVILVGLACAIGAFVLTLGGL